MKGIISTLVGDAVVAEHGDDARDALLQSAGATMLDVPADDPTRRPRDGHGHCIFDVTFARD